MKLRHCAHFTHLLLLSLICAFAVPALARPYEAGKFQSRIAWSADGNHNDPDDWAASPVALAIFAEAGLKDRLVHFDYNCILSETDTDWEKKHADSVLGAARHYGYDQARFFDCRKNLDGALASLVQVINASSATDPLYFIIAGPMEVPYARSKSRTRRSGSLCIASRTAVGTTVTPRKTNSLSPSAA
jgi:hypothetical protein